MSQESGEAELIEIAATPKSNDLVKQFNHYFQDTDLADRLMANYNSEQLDNQISLRQKQALPKQGKLVKENSEDNSGILVL